MSLAHNPSSPQAYLHPHISLPQQHLAAIQRIINDALALQSARPPPPPYNTVQDVQHPDTAWFKPRMDLYESPSVSGQRPLVTATFELPGLRKEDVRIEVLGNRMIVAGDRRHLPPSSAATEDREMEDEDAAAKAEEGEITVDRNADARVGYTVREIKRGRFRRVVPLPAGTKLEDVKASMHDGILTVTFPGSVRPVAQSVPVA